jgi:hypothetical protein
VVQNIPRDFNILKFCQQCGSLTGWSLQQWRKVFSVRYELDSYIYYLGVIPFSHLIQCPEVTQPVNPMLRSNRATLFLGNINTGTWPSSLGEFQMRQ